MNEKNLTLEEYCKRTGLGWPLPQPVSLRGEVVDFAIQMELKLRKNDHKTDWRTKPIEAFVKLLMLEVEEFKVADEFFTVEEARKELVDIANFALILHDRLGMIEQDKNRHTQSSTARPICHASIHQKDEIHNGYVNDCRVCYP